MLFFGWQGIAIFIGMAIAVVLLIYGFAKAID
jgi:hypothetical protein